MSDKEINRLTPPQRFAAMKLIEANGTREGDLYKYNIGWDDARVAALVGVDMKVIAHARKPVFGRLVRGENGEGSIASVKARLEQLEAANHDLALRVEALESIVRPTVAHQQKYNSLGRPA